MTLQEPATGGGPVEGPNLTRLVNPKGVGGYMHKGRTTHMPHGPSYSLSSSFATSFDSLWLPTKSQATKTVTPPLVKDADLKNAQAQLQDAQMKNRAQSTHFYFFDFYFLNKTAAKQNMTG